MLRPRWRWTALLSTALPLCACQIGVLAPAGPVARSERTILLDSLAIMLAIVIPTIVATFVFAWWYRESNSKARYLPNWSYSGRLEILTWSIPTLIILFLGGVIWTGSHELDPRKPLASSDPPVRVQVVSLDWKWLFIYPELRIASVNELVVPAGRPIQFELTSGSVMNSFFVPQLGGMIATMNRMVTHLNLQADAPGDYYGRSAQFSGHGFSGMQFMMRAVSTGEFENWVAATRGGGPVLDGTAYQALARQSQNVRPFTYREADPALFSAVVNHDLLPGPGPTGDSGTVDVHPRGAR